MADRNYNLNYLIHHIFLPPKLPHSDDWSAKNDHDMCTLILEAAVSFTNRSEFTVEEQGRWDPVIKMLTRLCLFYGDEIYTKDQLENHINGMIEGDVTAFLIRAQNAGFIIRKLADRTVYESFEVSVPNQIVMGNKGKLICSYPGPAISVKSDRANNPLFNAELANFLAQMNVDVFEDVMPTATKAGYEAVETRDTPHPRYITQLLTGILRGIGSPEHVPRISKRIADDILWDNTLLPWRRSPLWLVIRVALQTSLRDAADNSHALYKSFMVFLLSKLLLKAVEAEWESDLLSVMHKKVARRLYKIRETAPSFVRSEVFGTGGTVQALLRKRWESVQCRYSHGSMQGWDPKSLNLQRDTTLSLENSRRYIFNVLHKKDRSSLSKFLPSEHPRLKSLNQYTSTAFAEALERSGDLALYDFERAVEDEIDVWDSQCSVSEAVKRCSAISGWMALYSKEARSRYQGNPEEMSIMFLTLLELWIGLDKLCVSHCNLLLDYPPEVKEEFFTPLLLRRAKSIGRLKNAIEYLRKRQGKVIPKYPSIFSPSFNSNSFAIRFDDSKLRELRKRIDQEAESQRRKKVRELNNKNKRYQSLQQQVASQSHQNLSFNAETREWSHDKDYCPRCKVESEMAALRIRVLESLLPSDEVEAKGTVFELAPPPVFCIWRDTTYLFLRDICTPSTLQERNSTPKAEVELHNYSGLSSFAKSRQPSISGRLILASTSKSWKRTHYKSIKIPTTEDQIFLKNGLQLRLFDASDKVWISRPFDRVALSTECTFKVPAGPYSNLQYAVDSTTHTSNQVLAKQSECSRELSLHEYVSFGTLRAGARLQWLNLLRELRARILTFSHDAVEMLITQACLQIGPLSQDGRWDWHEDLYDPFFQLRLLGELNDLKDSIQANWSEVASLRVIVLLTRRILIWCGEEDIAEIAHHILDDARHIAYRWMKDASTKLQKTSDTSQSVNLQLRLCEMAGTCRIAFDLDSPAPDAPFTGVPEPQLPLNFMIEAGLTLRDNLPANWATTHFSSLLTLDRRLCHLFEPSLALMVADGRTTAFDQAILQYWPAYSPGACWVPQPAPNDRWLMSEGPHQMAFNVLENQLLINGKRLGRLPSEVMSNIMYTRIFGQAILDVVPSDEFGAQFVTKDFVSGYQLFFDLSAGSGLFTLKAKCRETNRRFQLIPHTKMSGDLPQFFVDDYAHWLNLDEGTVELRPLSSPWVSSPENWHLDCSKAKPYLWRDSSSGIIHLVDIRSKTASMIAERLRNFETIEFLTITHSTNTKVVTVDVPRYRLSFQLGADGHLSCLTLPDMMVDDNQSAGIMIGLQNRLVLRDKRWATKRELLVPVGEISFSSDEEHHALVSINTGSQRRASYYRYTIDDTLGRIMENAGLHAKLYKIYLIALTSHCLPDPLTGRRGTEEALYELRSASCRSFMRVDPGARALLAQIGALAPKRVYYPKHLHTMQTVEWRDLSFLSQSDMFYEASQDILDFAAKLQVFGDVQSSDDVQVTNLESETLLTERAAQRIACYSPADLQPSRRVPDHHHMSRDASGHGGSCMENLAFTFSNLIVTRPTRIPTIPDLLQELISWSTLKSSNIVPSYSRYLVSQPLSETWFPLYNLMKTRFWWRDGGWYQILFTLCAIGCINQEPNAHILVSTLIATAMYNTLFTSFTPLSNDTYQLSLGFSPDRDRIAQVAWNCIKPFLSDERADTIPADGGLDILIRYEYYQKCKQSEVEQVVESVMNHWPSRQPTLDGSYRVIDTDRCCQELIPLFDHWFHNHQLSIHFGQAQTLLGWARKAEVFTISTATRYTFEPNTCPSKTESSVPLLTLFREAPTVPLEPLPPLRPPISTPPSSRTKSKSETYREIHALIDSLQNRGKSIHGNYANDLRRSVAALQAETRPYTTTKTSKKDLETFHAYHQECTTYLHKLVGNIQKALVTPQDTVTYFGVWPNTELRSLLESIASIRPSRPPSRWITVLQHLARALLLFQRSRRLLRLAELEKYDDLWKELETDSSVMEVENCDWLLTQVDSDFLMRPVQLAVAQEMIAPSTEQNTLLQLNMGEGKSSVIVPIVAAAIADGKKLARVIVLKSLVGQMFSLLRQRLGGLTNRRIIYLPFSRAVKLGNDDVQQIWEIFQYARETGSVLVAQPEHVLSFKLMTINRLVERDALSKLLVETQLWLDKCSRDLLDESDEILHTRYQLVYTVGNQQMVEHGSERWKLIQQVLSLAKKCARWVQRSFPSGIDIGESSNDSFPSIRILQKEAGEGLVSEMLEQVMEGGLAGFYVERFPPRIREAARVFIMNGILYTHDMEALKNLCSDTSLWKNLLLLRGLFGYGILAYTLKERRWRVDFGLDLSRSLLAVPYRAKDVPSLRAEFGHPDVAIVLTCLSYLYGGLSQSELETCFQLLLKLDNPELEYDRWVRFADVPEGLRSIAGVNIKDSDQRQDVLFPIFRRNHACIDFYLSSVVFPKAMKEFPQKLSTSGWDLACQKAQITTGFSGTNESRYLLPTSISQEDTPERISTNASMLVLLSQPENDWYLSPSTHHLSGRQIIDAVVDNPKKCDIRVLLDVGAQILEMTNIQVAQYWLSRRPDALAAVFFNENDELEVMDRDGTKEFLAMSPFHQRLDGCLVYLDDAHTRGTDLQLPTTWKACVTLGPKVTKDRLAQGCMRMRKLGHGQSVMFLAPPDIDIAVRQRANKLDPSSTINSRDVLLWAMLETCAEIEHHVPHWLQQGVDFHTRNEGWKALSVARGPTEVLGNVTATWLQPEARTLQDMYGFSPNLGDSKLVVKARNIPEIWTRCEMLGIASILDPRLAEEQEREVHHELELETQIQRPPIAYPAEHVLHRHVSMYVELGLKNIPESSEAFGAAFVEVRDGVAGVWDTAAPAPTQVITTPVPPPSPRKKNLKGKRTQEPQSTPQSGTLQLLSPVWNLSSANKLTWDRPVGSGPRLFATKDFLQTVRATSSSSACDYLRPLNWVLTSRHSSSIMILSPHEVNELLPAIRESKNVRLHIYTPRITPSMKPSDDLQLYSIPFLASPISTQGPSEVINDWPLPNTEAIDQLNLCAGQLYFSNYEAYIRTSAFLGLSTPEDQKYNMEIEGDGFVRPENRVGKLALKCGFRKSPVPYLKALTGFRRKGMTFEPTHLGKILHGRLLRESDF